jgi:hypothetical protein
MGEERVVRGDLDRGCSLLRRGGYPSPRVQSGGHALGGSGGILLVNGAIFGAAAPTGNSIRLNSLSGNTPNDI